jgi:hypothetical protein
MGLGHDRPMATDKQRAEAAAKKAINLRQQAQSSSSDARQALIVEASLEATLAVYYQLGHATDEQSEHAAALKKHGAIMEESAAMMLRAARMPGRQGR